jgi:hypothetical protein
MITAELARTLLEALEQADLYLNSYDTSAPSRIKAQTREIVAMALDVAARNPDARRTGWLP